MNRRLLGNSLLGIFVIVTLSGVLMYFTPFEKNIASLHTFFALLFIIAVILHVVNNKLPLSNYLTGKKQAKLKKLQSPLIFLVILSLATGLYFNLPLLDGVYVFGNQFRNKQIGKSEEIFDYQIIELDKNVGKHKISLELKKGKSFKFPLFAVWVEDSAGNYIETLYISRVIASSTFRYGKKVNDTWESAVLRRPEALPYWSHKRGIQASDGLFIPLDDSPDLDGVSGATPTNNFIVKSTANFRNSNVYRVLIEINQSFDWNEYFSKDRFPNDEIYSGSGQIGQPSLIYAAEMEVEEVQPVTYKIMNLIGHGHYSGKDGKLYQDLSHITTAKNIAERIILTVEEVF